MKEQDAGLLKVLGPLAGDALRLSGYDKGGVSVALNPVDSKIFEVKQSLLKIPTLSSVRLGVSYIPILSRFGASSCCLWGVFSVLVQSFALLLQNLSKTLLMCYDTIHTSRFVRILFARYLVSLRGTCFPALFLASLCGSGNYAAIVVRNTGNPQQ